MWGEGDVPLMTASPGTPCARWIWLRFIRKRPCVSEIYHALVLTLRSSPNHAMREGRWGRRGRTYGLPCFGIRPVYCHGDLLRVG